MATLAFRGAPAARQELNNGRTVVNWLIVIVPGLAGRGKMDFGFGLDVSVAV